MLPFSYNEDRLMIVPVDPNTLFAYWDFSKETWDSLTQEEATHLHLTLHSNGSSRIFSAGCETRNYYFKGIPSNQEYVLELGIGTRVRVIPLMESMPATTPADRPSDNRLVQFKRFRFLAPPARPGQPAANWRDYYRRGSGHWGIYGDLAKEMENAARETKSTPPSSKPAEQKDNRALYYYYQGADFRAGGSSGSLPSSPHPTAPSSHSVLQPVSIGGPNSEFRRGGQYGYYEEHSVEESIEPTDADVREIDEERVVGEAGSVSSRWTSYFGSSSQSQIARGGSSSTTPQMTARRHDGTSKE